MILGTLRPLGYKYSPVNHTGLKTHFRAFYGHAVQGLPAVLYVPFCGLLCPWWYKCSPAGLAPVLGASVGL